MTVQQILTQHLGPDWIVVVQNENSVLDALRQVQEEYNCDIVSALNLVVDAALDADPKSFESLSNYRLFRLEIQAVVKSHLKREGKGLNWTGSRFEEILT